jgi:hypothetical protein
MRNRSRGAAVAATVLFATVVLPTAPASAATGGLDLCLQRISGTTTDAYTLAGDGPTYKQASPVTASSALQCASWNMDEGLYVITLTNLDDQAGNANCLIAQATITRSGKTLTHPYVENSRSTQILTNVAAAAKTVVKFVVRCDSPNV